MKASERYAVTVEALYATQPPAKRWLRYAGELVLTILTDDHRSLSLDRFAVRVISNEDNSIVAEHRFGHDYDAADRDASFIREQLQSLTTTEFENAYGISGR